MTLAHATTLDPVEAVEVVEAHVVDEDVVKAVASVAIVATVVIAERAVVEALVAVVEGRVTVVLVAVDVVVAMELPSTLPTLRTFQDLEVHDGRAT